MWCCKYFEPHHVTRYETPVSKKVFLAYSVNAYYCSKKYGKDTFIRASLNRIKNYSNMKKERLLQIIFVFKPGFSAKNYLSFTDHVPQFSLYVHLFDLFFRYKRFGIIIVHQFGFFRNLLYLIYSTFLYDHFVALK